MPKSRDIQYLGKTAKRKIGEVALLVKEEINTIVMMGISFDDVAYKDTNNVAEMLGNTGFSEREELKEIGYYCLLTLMIPELCLPGYYCLPGTEEATQYPCRPGTYNGRSGIRSEGECLLCPAGQHCNESGLTEPSGLCAPGYYCTGGSTTDKPTPNHLTWNVSSNSTSEYKWCPEQYYSMGGLCPAGHYCPPGSPSPVPCDGGKYCSNPGLTMPSGGCLAGYYCDAASTQPDQHICPAGLYCPRGTAIPMPCPPGTYGNSTGNREESDCQLCLGGQYCDGKNV
ncbi:uncharacterized protein [Scyliorhinus torazame]|uniref:uncharacterized protein n=1 Tax=Scyliorhinus torazame TaxID=75743 RepID=UPI003B5A3C49